MPQVGREVGIYKMKQENKKTRKQESDQENKKTRKQELDQESDQEKKKVFFLFFLGRFLGRVLVLLLS